MSKTAIVDILKMVYNKIMGHYHGSFPENVQENKTRGRCRECGKKRFAKFLVKVNDWHQGQWECRSNCSNNY